MSQYSPSLCCVEDILYVGGTEENGASDAFQIFDLSACAWKKRAQLREPRGGFSACVQLDGRLDVGGYLEANDDNPCDSVFSYNPPTGGGPSHRCHSGTMELNYAR